MFDPKVGGGGGRGGPFTPPGPLEAKRMLKRGAARPAQAAWRSAKLDQSDDKY